jgi:predicted ATP-dependent serine protease|tara:strand:- start:199 stop:861 length:663 start_codon:yes stop_codon:yes gene_type:complete
MGIMIPRLPTTCEGVDKLLAGGYEQGTVSLVYGEAGTGKTSMALQLSREAINLYPDHVVLFVDTEGLSIERMTQIFGDCDASKLLMIRPSSLSDLHQTLTGKLEQHDKISLVVVDTINAYVRLSYMKNKQLSSRQFLEMTSILQPLAEKGDYPVLITAQVFEKDGEIGPYFGKSLMHLCKTIIHLEKKKVPSSRRIRLKKHRSLPEESVEDFTLTNNGIE